MYFKDIIGQEDIKARLRRTATTQAIPHAQLFSEAGGVGAYPLALAYARYLNCLHPSPDDACGQCPSCRKYDKLAHPDLFLVFPIIKRKDDRKDKPTLCDDYLDKWRDFLSSSPYFTFDHWRSFLDVGNAQPHIFAAESNHLIRCLSLKPAEANYRVILLWMPEKMQTECANKLLKVIEEPPPHTLILMISEAPDLILATIRSRSQRIHIPPILVETLAGHLVQRYALAPDEALHIARLSSGNYVRAVDAISLTEERDLFLRHFQDLMRNAYARQVKNLKTWAETLAAIGREEQKNFLRYAQQMLRENFICRFRLPELNYMNTPETAFAQNFSPFITPLNVTPLMEALANAENDIDRNVNSKFVFFDLALKVIPFVRLRE
ncbi:MAG: DNA polymerase III subunit delta [Tannerellaceae bacterium]|jgi:DNA polymerase-3 subunit delta'|nr:DNA polymerase III subunit delta [Tannerellaceae bacterium]